MIPALSFAAVLAAAVPAIALAQAQPVTQGVISYPPAYFAEQRPSTALDMVQRLPGFSIDGGDDVRGFEGAAGNILIDGARPTSKTDDIEEILRVTPAPNGAEARSNARNRRERERAPAIVRNVDAHTWPGESQSGDRVNCPTPLGPRAPEKLESRREVEKEIGHRHGRAAPASHALRGGSLASDDADGNAFAIH